MIPLPTDAQPFESLAAMKARHKDLLRTAPPGEDPGSVRARVVEFLARGKATGRILDCPTDRRVAQGLIDYWKATFYTQLRDEDTEGTLDSPALTILEDFAETDSEALAAAAEKTVAALSDEDREIARRILLKLVQLEPAVRDVHPISVPRSALDEAGNVGNVAHVIRELTKAGVIRTLPNPPSVELTAAHLVRTWKRYEDWLKDRLALRTAAYLWQQQDRPVSALTSGRELGEAASYRDIDGVEREFIEKSRRYEEHKRKFRSKIMTGLIGAMLLAIVGLIAVILLQSKLTKTEKDKKVFEEAAEYWKDDAESKSKRATDINRMMRGLSEIVVADTEAEEKLTRWRWEQMEKEVKADPMIKAALTEQALNLKRIRELKTGYSRNARDKKGRAALEIGLALRNKCLDAEDEKVKAMMESVRKVTYFTGEQVTRELMAAVSRDYASFPDVKPFIREFWRLYWGPLGMVEGKEVETAMVGFGRAINAWEDEYEARGKSSKKPIGDRPSPSIQRELNAAGARLIAALRGDATAEIRTHQSQARE